MNLANTILYTFTTIGVITITILYVLFTPEKEVVVIPDEKKSFNFGASEDLDISLLETPSFEQDDVGSGGIVLQREVDDIDYVTNFKITDIFKGSVAGYSFDIEEGQLVVNLVEQGTGHFYKIKTSPYSVERISNKTIPRAYSAFIGDNLVSAISFEDDSGNESSFVFSPFDSSKTTFLTESLAISFSDITNALFYTQKTSSGVSGLVFNTNSKQRRNIWSSPFRSWNVYWGENSSITLVTKPSYAAIGFAYLLSPRTGKITLVAGPGRGLNVLVNEREGLSLITSDGFSYIDNGKEKIKLESLVLPEKCTWSEDTLFCGRDKKIPRQLSDGSPAFIPDSWYLGDLSFNDEIVSFPPPYTEENIIVEGSNGIDATNLKVFKNKKLLLFINKKDGSLWSVTL